MRITGDPPPEVPLRMAAVCDGARDVYGRLFREGEDRVLADVLVAVTGYSAFVPAKDEVVNVRIENCAYTYRTYSMTFGQRMDVINSDASISYVPVLHGSRFTAVQVAVPASKSGVELKTDPVRLYPQAPGQYLLGDYMMRTWMAAEVFVLKFPTHTVTGLDGRFRIEGIPVGDVNVDALLPAVDASESKKAAVRAGETTTVEFELTFNQAEYERKKEASAARAASAAPRASSAPDAPVLR